MKQLLYVGALAVAASSVLFSACSGSNPGPSFGNRDDDSDFEIRQAIKSASRVYRIESADDTAYLELATTLQWPEQFGSYDIDSLQRYLLLTCYNVDGDNPGDAISIFLTDTDQMGDSYVAVEVDSVSVDDALTRSYEAEVTASITEQTVRSVTYNITSYTYMGGAHPNTSSRPFTYLFEEKTVLTPELLFKPGTEAEVEAAVREALAAQYNVAATRLTDAGFFGNDVPLSQSVYVSQGAIVFHYNPYEIAPYSSGSIDVEVQPYAVSHLLTPLALKYFDL